MSNYVIDEKEKARLEGLEAEAHRQMDKLSPEKRKIAMAAKRAADKALAESNDIIFGNHRRELDALTNFFNHNGINGDESKERFLLVAKQTEKGNLFCFQQKAYVRGHNDVILPAQDYIRSLELTIIDQVQFNEVEYKTIAYEPPPKPTKREPNGKQKVSKQ